MSACASMQGKRGRIAPLGESLWLNHVIQFSNRKVGLQLLQLLFLNRRYFLLKHPSKLIMYFLFSPLPSVYWPLFVLIFYFICPIPHFIAKRVSDDSDAASSACRELAYFFTTGIVVSAFGFPIILARVEAVSSAC